MVLPAAEPVGRKPIGRAQSDGEFVQSPPGAGAVFGPWRQMDTLDKSKGPRRCSIVQGCRSVDGLLEWRARPAEPLPRRQARFAQKQWKRASVDSLHTLTPVDGVSLV